MARTAVKEALIEGLTQDMNLELEAVLRYLYHASAATGLLGHELRELVKADIGDELNHAIFLADKITALGGELKIDVTMPKSVKTTREMMDLDTQGERKGIARYVERIKQAEEFGDKGLVIKLENILAEETDHAEELERLGR